MGGVSYSITKLDRAKPRNGGADYIYQCSYNVTILPNGAMCGCANVKDGPYIEVTSWCDSVSRMSAIAMCMHMREMLNEMLRGGLWKLSRTG